jgi:hypothetical protein
LVEAAEVSDTQNEDSGKAEDADCYEDSECQIEADDQGLNEEKQQDEDGRCVAEDGNDEVLPMLRPHDFRFAGGAFPDSDQFVITIDPERAVDSQGKEQEGGAAADMDSIPCVEGIGNHPEEDGHAQDVQPQSWFVGRGGIHSRKLLDLLCFTL